MSFTIDATSSQGDLSLTCGTALETLNKVRELARVRKERDLQFSIEIDGGAGLDNIAEIAAAGVDWVVAGSSVFRSADPAETIRKMLHVAQEAISIKV